MKKLLIILPAVLLFQVCVYSQYPEVTIPGSEVRKITSSIIKGQEYELQISLPAGYKKNSIKKYPVLYLMDAQWDFPLLKSLYGQQYYDGFIPAIIIVGVTWGGLHPDPDSLRARDYTPTNEKRLPQSGGAAQYLSFMKSELIPFIESNYNADKNDRILMGCSLGGLFTMYALFTEPGLFQRYVAASPAYSWGDEIIYQYEKKYSENKSNPPAKLFMCVGGVERGVPGFRKLTDHLNNRHYTNLQIESRVLENTGHSGTKGEGFARGLQYVYKRPQIDLPLSLINKYAGNYQSEKGNKLEIKEENNRLTIYYSYANKFVLYASGKTSFYSTGEFLNIYFKLVGDVVDGFQLEEYTGSEYFKKIIPVHNFSFSII